MQPAAYPNHRSVKHAELEEAKRKMATACQNGSKKAWRRYGKKIVKIQRELNLPVETWMEEAFGRAIEE